MSDNCPIIVLSLNRSDRLRAVLESLRAQKGARLSGRNVTLFQDGVFNPISNQTYAEQSEVDACVAVFKEIIPDGRVFTSDVNLGVALNYERAEQYVFQDLKAEAGIFLQDNILLSDRYIAIIEYLLTANAKDSRVGYVSAYGDHSVQIQPMSVGSGKLTAMHAARAFGLYRRQWEVMRPYIEKYLELLRLCDYRLRDHLAIGKLFASWGFSPPVTSYDAACTLACCLTKTIRVNTAAIFARVIDGDIKRAKSNETQVRFPSVGPWARFSGAPFESITANIFHQVLADLIHWSGRPKSTSRDLILETSARDLFHDTNEQARCGQLDDAGKTAASALTALFRQKLPGWDVLAGFYPMTSIRNVTNESHVRFDLRGNVLRMLCPKQMITAHFTNYFHGFSVISALLGSSASKKLPTGGFTVDLEGSSKTGDYERVAFSSRLPASVLVIDPEFFISSGYEQLRERINEVWTDWRDRDDLAYWRGNTTGIQSRQPSPEAESKSDFNWKWLQRLEFCDKSQRSSYASRLNVGLTEIVQIDTPNVLQAISDAKFLRTAEPPEALTKYRYVFVLDGNTSVGNGMLQAMLAGTCVLRVESRDGFRSWYYDKLHSGQTHIAIRSDLSDFEQQLAWVFDNPDKCEQIANNGRALAESMQFKEELQSSVNKLQAVIKP